MSISSGVYQKGPHLGHITIDDISAVVKPPETFVWVGPQEPDDTLPVHRRSRRAGWV